MPCNSDYLEANGDEIESKRVAQCLRYVLNELQETVHSDIINASEDYYGSVNHLNEWVIRLPM